MRRREFISLLGSAIVGGPEAIALDAKLYRVGLLWDSPAMFPTAIEALRQGLHELGWVEGKNLDLEHRWTEGRFGRLQALAQELVRLKVDVRPRNRT